MNCGPVSCCYAGCFVCCKSCSVNFCCSQCFYPYCMLQLRFPVCCRFCLQPAVRYLLYHSWCCLEQLFCTGCFQVVQHCCFEDAGCSAMGQHSVLGFLCRRLSGLHLQVCVLRFPWPVFPVHCCLERYLCYYCKKDCCSFCRNIPLFHG